MVAAWQFEVRQVQSGGLGWYLASDDMLIFNLP